jgi:hypothetical protein
MIENGWNKEGLREPTQCDNCKKLTNWKRLIYISKNPDVYHCTRDKCILSMPERFMPFTEKYMIDYLAKEDRFDFEVIGIIIEDKDSCN